MSCLSSQVQVSALEQCESAMKPAQQAGLHFWAFTKENQIQERVFLQSVSPFYWS